MKKAADSGASHRAVSRPWLPEDDATLLDLAGYEPVDRIAERLNRSERAVRFRLGALGMRARVTDDWSQRALRKLLRMSRTRLRQLVASGMLRVRDPPITRASLASCCATHRPVDPSSTSASTAVLSLPEGPCPWKRAAKILNMEVVDVQKLISAGQLKLMDTFVTDRSFEDFCRKHGNEINMALIDPSTSPSSAEAHTGDQRMQVWEKNRRECLFQACQALPPSCNPCRAEDLRPCRTESLRSCRFARFPDEGAKNIIEVYWLRSKTRCSRCFRSSESCPPQVPGLRPASRHTRRCLDLRRPATVCQEDRPWSRLHCYGSDCTPNRPDVHWVDCRIGALPSHGARERSTSKRATRCFTAGKKKCI